MLSNSGHSGGRGCLKDQLIVWPVRRKRGCGYHCFIGELRTKAESECRARLSFLGKNSGHGGVRVSKVSPFSGRYDGNVGWVPALIVATTADTVVWVTEE
jgi:hypothetical protein